MNKNEEERRRRKRREEERRITKSKFSSFRFSTSEWGSKTLGAFLTFFLCYSKGLLSVSVLAHFAVFFSELLPHLKVTVTSYAHALLAEQIAI